MILAVAGSGLVVVGVAGSRSGRMVDKIRIKNQAKHRLLCQEDKTSVSFPRD